MINSFLNGLFGEIFRSQTPGSKVIDVDFEDISEVTESEPIYEDWTDGTPKIININSENNE